MTAKTIEIEGTWEQISEQASRFVGHRMRLTILTEPVDDAASTDGAPTIEERIAGMVATVPDEEWARLPSDMGDNLDHYIYGIPGKR